MTIRKDFAELDALIAKKEYSDLPDYVQYPDPYKELKLIREILGQFSVILHSLIAADKSSQLVNPFSPAVDAGPPRSTPRS